MLLLFAYALLPPTPSNEQILEAITASNNAPLELVYEKMQVLHRYSGKAGAVLSVEDRSLQRNFTVVYGRKAKTFYVESLSALRLGEDDVYRNEQS